MNAQRTDPQKGERRFDAVESLVHSGRVPKRKSLAKSPRAFTLIELTVVVVVLVVLLAMLFPAVARQKRRSQIIQCAGNLQQIGLALKTSALEGGDSYHKNVEAKQSNSAEAVSSGEVFRHFLVISNELSTPRILVCPADVRSRASDFGAGFSNSHVSYFVGVDAEDTQPNAFLSGDRNLTNGSILANRILVLSTNHLVGWTHELHHCVGNVLLSDGSVQQLDNSGLRTALQRSGVTNRLAMP